ncbi:MAG: flippase [bacterium]|nr:flippase [bacterium]
MSFFPSVAKNTTAQLAGRGGAVLAAFVTTAVLTRLLGTSGYGNYIFILSLVFFFVSVADWGTSLIFVRESVRSGAEEKKFYGNALLFRLLLAILSLIVMNLVVLVLPPLQSLALPLQAASSLLILISLKTSAHIIFQTKLKFEFIALTDVFVSFTFLFLILLFFPYLSITFNLLNVIYAFVAANLLGTIFALYLSTKLSQVSFRLDKDILKKILFAAMPTGALLFVFSIYNRLDIFLLQILQGPEPVGIYGLAYKVHDNLILGSAYLAAALFPIISVLAGKPNTFDQLKNIYRKIFDILLVAGVVVSVSTYFLAPWIVSAIGGEAFAGSVVALRILVFATLLAYFNHLNGYMIIALGKQKISLIIAVIALSWNLGLNLVLIPYFSYMAAAAVTIATEGMVLLLTSYYLARNFSLTPGMTLFSTLKDLVRTRGKIF